MNFLGRVAARAVGASAAAQPRLPGLFEPTEAAEGATLEVVDEEVVARPEPRPRQEETRAPDDRRAPARPADAPLAQLPRDADPPDASAEPRLSERIDLVAQSNYVPATATFHAGPPEAAPEPSSAPHVERSGPPSVVVAAPSLSLALPAAAAREAAPAVAAAAAREEPPPVRVHIGRLEVRANVTPPAPERPSRESTRAEGLSLADYLRGKREGRS